MTGEMTGTDSRQEQFLQLLKEKKILVFGTGYVAEMFWHALEKQGLTQQVSAFVVSCPEPAGESFHDRPVLAAGSLGPDEGRPVCIAVHGSLMEKVKNDLQARGIRQIVWVYPFLHELIFGKPFRYVEMRPGDLLARQDRSDNWIAVRYLAAKDCLRSHDHCPESRELYLRAMSAHCSRDTAQERLEELEKLTESMRTRGFDRNYPILIDERGRIIDGLHRFAAACALGIGQVSCAVVAETDSYDMLFTQMNRLSVSELLHAGITDELLHAAAAAKEELSAMAANTTDVSESIPRVSVIIPVYNVEEYLDICMKTVVQQTFPDFEVLLINDGSTDGSAEKCRYWAALDPRIRFTDKPNEGVAASRNLGVQMARGEYIAFVDPDDWLDETYLEKLLQPLELTGADFSECDLWRCDNRTGKKIYRSCYGKMGRPYTLAEHMKYAPTATYKALSRRRLWTGNGIRMPDCAFESPAVYALVLALAGGVKSVREPLYFYRRFRENSLVETGYAEKDGTPNNTMGVEAMEHLIREFSRCGLMEKWGGILEGVVKYRLSDILAMQFHRKAPEDFRELAANHRAFLAGAFPGGRNEVYVTWGGYNLNKILTHMDWLHDPACRFNFSSIAAVCGEACEIGAADGKTEEQHDAAGGEGFCHRNRYRQIMLERERKRSIWTVLREQKPAWFFLDFLEERFDLLGSGERYYTASDAWEGAERRPAEVQRRVSRFSTECTEIWMKAARTFFAEVRSTAPGIRFVFVENYLSETCGDLTGQQEFAEIGQIRQTNALLATYYAYAEELCPDAVVIRPADDPLYFTDRKYEYGAIPPHLNELVNQKIAKKIEEKLDNVRGKERKCQKYPL